MLTQEVGHELVVYDERTHEAHRLNRTAALVWRLADGRRSVAELASLVHAAIGVPEDEEFVRLALAELDLVGLLAQPLSETSGLISRRHLFQVAAYLLPVVASIVAPTPAMAQSPCTFLPNPQSVTLERHHVAAGSSRRG